MDNQDDKTKEMDEANDQFTVEKPIWATDASDSTNLAPPPTYNPSAYSAAPLDAMPSFKPRKSNRVSVLAYSPEASKTTTATSNTLPAGGPPGGGGGGIKLPPPPVKGTGRGQVPSPVPYNKDFRTAQIDNHWNDPPTKIFDRNTKSGESTSYDFSTMNSALTAVIKECSSSVPAPQKRMFEDTVKRLQVLQEQMEQGTVKESVVIPLGDLIQALSSKTFTQCHSIHAKLMQTEFESEGKWLLGFKRLIDLYASLQQ
ncbi:hypothetical protein BGZ76_011135 [Entomortierella beljakovae]|nr:hypothetical protein BGZ76_011135 [Entomortierella beljakovae]